MLRKLSIVTFAAIFGRGTIEQAYCTGFLVLFWVAIQAMVRPYKYTEGECFLESISMSTM